MQKRKRKTLAANLIKLQNTLNSFDGTKAKLLIIDSPNTFTSGLTKEGLLPNSLQTRLFIPTNQQRDRSPSLGAIVDTYIALLHEHRHAVQKTHFYFNNEPNKQAFAVYDMITHDIGTLRAEQNTAMYIRNPNEIDAELYALKKAPQIIRRCYPKFSIEDINRAIANLENDKIHFSDGDYFIPKSPFQRYSSVSEIIDVEEEYLAKSFYMPIDIDIKNLIGPDDEKVLGCDPTRLETMFNAEQNGLIQGITLVDLICKLSEKCAKDRRKHYRGITDEFLSSSLINKCATLMRTLNATFTSAYEDNEFTPHL